MYKVKPVIRILNDHQGNVSATVSIDDIDYKVSTNIIGLSPKARDARIRALAWAKHAKSIVKPEQVWVHKPPSKLSKGPSQPSKLRKLIVERVDCSGDIVYSFDDEISVRVMKPEELFENFEVLDQNPKKTILMNF